MILGYPQTTLAFLFSWVLLSLVCLLRFHSRGGKFWVVLPALSALVSAVWMIQHHARSDGADVGHFFLFNLSLLQSLCLLLLDEGATTIRVKAANLGAMLLAGFAFYTNSLVVFAGLWILGILPSVLAFEGEEQRHARRVFLWHHGVSGAALLAAVFLLAGAGGSLRMDAVQELEVGVAPRAALLLLLLASFIRQGIFPFHLWFKASYKAKPFPLSIGFYMANLGFLLFFRLVLPLMRHTAADAFPIVLAWGVVSGLYFANMALVQRRLRSTAFYVMLSQFSVLFCGLEAGTRLGQAGVLFQFVTMGCCFGGIIALLSLLEHHLGELRARRFHGLQQENPLLAALFLGLCLAGMAMPFTMGFAGEDLVLHAVIEHYPVTGMGLILAAALNGIALFRLVCFLFRGQRHDVLSARIQLSFPQKLALAAVVGMLVLFGLWPGALLEHVLTFV